MINPLDSNTTAGPGGLTITGEGAGYLKETGGWAKFVAILGFFFVGVIVVVAFFYWFAYGKHGNTGFQTAMTAFYLVMAALYFFPILYLFRFATKVVEAVKSGDTQTLTAALENLKSHYKFIGILMAIILGLYALGFLVAIIGGGSALFG